MRVALLVSAIVAVLFAASTVLDIGVLPPHIAYSVAAAGGAHTQILVDGPAPGVLDTRTSTDGYEWLDNGAELLSGLLVTQPLSRQVAFLAGVPFSDISFASPRTPIMSPASSPSPVSQAHAYSLTIAARPSVPILDVYAQGPTPAGALRLVDATFDALRAYMADPSAPRLFALRITQLGNGRIVYRTTGFSPSELVLRFFAALLVCCLAVLLIGRRLRVRSSIRSPLPAHTIDPGTI